MTNSILPKRGNSSFSGNAFYNRSLFETENFKVIPSLGSLVQGWLMVVPKQFYISFGAINDTEIYNELNELMNELGIITKAEYGDFVIFEHGPVAQKSLVGCSVDYAHLHIVPLSIDLIKQSGTLSNREIFWSEAEGVQDTSKYYGKRVPYLYVRDINRKSFIGVSEEIPSQLFRKTIAKHIGVEDMYDWRKHAFLNNIEATIAALIKYKEEPAQV